MSLGYAAKKCDLSLWEMMDEVKERKIKVPYSIEDLKEDIEAL
jgi:predicted HTH domain antitoxin